MDRHEIGYLYPMSYRISFLVLLSLLLVGCNRTQRSDLAFTGKALRVSEPIYEIQAVKLSDSTVRLSFVGSPTLRTPGRNVAWVEALVGPDENALNDNLVFATSTAGAPGAEETVTIVGEASWDTDAAKKSKRLVADVSVVTSQEHLIYRTVVEYSRAEPMELTPFTSAVNDTTMEVGVIARRVFVPAGEYLPSSENVRLIISNEQGAVVYRSDAGQSFLQLVTTVEPQNVGQMQRYVVPWNGRDLQKERVPDGMYKAEVIIPARPDPYKATIDVPWPPK